MVAPGLRARGWHPSTGDAPRDDGPPRPPPPPPWIPRPPHLPPSPPLPLSPFLSLPAAWGRAGWEGPCAAGRRMLPTAPPPRPPVLRPSAGAPRTQVPPPQSGGTRCPPAFACHNCAPPLRWRRSLPSFPSDPAFKFPLPRRSLPRDCPPGHRGRPRQGPSSGGARPATDARHPSAPHPLPACLGPAQLCQAASPALGRSGQVCGCTVASRRPPSKCHLSQGQARSSPVWSTWGFVRVRQYEVTLRRPRVTQQRPGLPVLDSHASGFKLAASVRTYFRALR